MFTYKQPVFDEPISDQFLTLRCPVCNSPFTHQGAVQPVEKEYGMELARTGGFKLAIACEGGEHSFYLCVGQHKGNTVLWTEHLA